MITFGKITKCDWNIYMYTNTQIYVYIYKIHINLSVLINVDCLVEKRYAYGVILKCQWQDKSEQKWQGWVHVALLHTIA